MAEMPGTSQLSSARSSEKAVIEQVIVESEDTFTEASAEPFNSLMSALQSAQKRRHLSSQPILASRPRTLSPTYKGMESPSNNLTPLRKPSILRTSPEIEVEYALLRPASSASMGLNENFLTPSPASSTAGKGRVRGQSRSSSVPSQVNLRNPLLSDQSLPGSARVRASPHPYGKPSVKHLTCHWWRTKNDCRYSEEDCLYAHHDTGVYAEAPRQLVAGEPAIAGRNLEKAIRRAERNKSSTSLPGMMNSPRPGTARHFAHRPIRPVSVQTSGHEIDARALPSDQAFFRSLVEQGVKEKAVLVTTIENLQIENKNIKEALESIQADKKALAEEIEKLRETVSQLQLNQRARMLFTNANPFGAVGDRRSGP